jgi:hypothetical protein
MRCEYVRVIALSAEDIARVESRDIVVRFHADNGTYAVREGYRISDKQYQLQAIVRSCGNAMSGQ